MSRNRSRGRRGKSSGGDTQKRHAGGPQPRGWISRVSPKLEAFIKWLGFGGIATILGWAGWKGIQPEPDTFAADRVAILATLERSDAPPEALGRAIADLRRLAADSLEAALISEDLARFIERRTTLPGSPVDEPCRPSPHTGPQGLAPAYIGEALVALAGLRDLTRNPHQVVLAGGANLSGVHVSGVDLAGADLRGVCLRQANLEGADLRGATLRRAVLDSAHLAGARLDSAHMEMARLVGAQLIEASLSAVRLTQADLRRASLISADLSLGRLGGADLSEADLSGAALGGAYLKGAKLAGIRSWGSVGDFESANLNSVGGLTEAQRQRAFDLGAVDLASEEAWQRERETYEGRH